MNAITAASKASFGAILAAIPHSLARQLNDLRGSYYPGAEPGDAGLSIAPQKPEYHPAAQSALAALQPLCAVASEAAVTEWLLKLAAGVQQPPGEDDMPLRIAAVRTACHDIPAGAWTPATLAEALQTFDWWPAAAKIHALLKPHAARILGTRDRLEQIANAGTVKPTAEAESVERSDESKAEVAALLKTFVAERSFSQTSGDAVGKPPVQPRHLSDGQLLAEYERLSREGVVGAATRVAMLRKKIKESARQMEAAQ